MKGLSKITLGKRLADEKYSLNLAQSFKVTNLNWLNLL